MTLVINLTGKTFGKLIVLSRAKNSKAGKARWKCRCQCGYLHTAVGSSLTSGHTVSCGCHKIDAAGKQVIKPPGHAAFVTRYSSCRTGAKSRGLSFNLTLEEHSSIIINNCYYCDKPPQLYNPYSSPAYDKRKYKILPDTVSRAWIRANGVDRVDNTLGYSLDNCVSCCTECNEGKSDRPKQDFIDRAYRIVALDLKRKKDAA